MTPEQLIAEIRASLGRYEFELIPPPPPEPLFVIADPVNVQSVLDTATKPVHLVAGAEYPKLVINHPLELVGNGASVVGNAGPAVYVTPGVTGVTISDLSCGCTNWRGGVVQLGDNSSTTQGSVDVVPKNLVVRNVTIPTHRGKAGFEIHATDVDLIDCSAYDVWDPGLSDSKAIWIHNTPGVVRVTGGHFEAGSENVMIGGDSVKIPGNTPTNITIDGVILQKPLSWQTDGVNRAVKNLFEIKAGRNVILRNSVLDGSWVASQTGWAVVITPKNANIVDGVLVEGCTVKNVGGLVQLMGLDYNTITPQATRNVVFRNCDITVSKAQFGGQGCLSTMTGGMKDITFDNIRGTFDGSQLVISDSTAAYGQQGPLTITGCSLPTGQYGLKADGVNYGDPLLAGSVYIGQELLIGSISGNTFTGAPTRFKTNFPNNIYV
jgi:hypothetical protein